MLDNGLDRRFLDAVARQFYLDVLAGLELSVGHSGAGVTRYLPKNKSGLEPMGAQGRTSFLGLSTPRKNRESCKG